MRIMDLKKAVSCELKIWRLEELFIYFMNGRWPEEVISSLIMTRILTSSTFPFRYNDNDNLLVMDREVVDSVDKETLFGGTDSL